VKLLKPKSPQTSFYGSYLYDRIIPQDHLLRKINQVVDFSFVTELVKDRYTPDFGKPAIDPEFMLRLCLLQYIYGDSDRQVIENARVNLAYKYFLGLAVDEEVPDDTTICYFRTQRLGEEKFREIFQQIVQQCIDKGLVTGKRQIIDSTHIVADIAINSLSGLLKLCRKNVLQEVEKQSPEIAEKLGIKEIEFTQQDKYTKAEQGLEKETKAAADLLDGVTKEFKHKIKYTVELRKGLELLEKAVADRAEGAKDRLVSPVDPDARMGKKDTKRWAGYKSHMIVEEDSEIITAIETTPANKEDGSQLKVLLKQQEEASSVIPSELIGDKAYGTGVNLELLSIKGISGTISLPRKINQVGADLFTNEDFYYDPVNDTLTCPAGQVAVYRRRAIFHNDRHKRNGYMFQFSHHQCVDCKLKPKCECSLRKWEHEHLKIVDT
jgi:transposase